MDKYPSYIPDDQGIKKKYEKVFRNYRYKEDSIIDILKLFNLESPSEYYFTSPINHGLFEYILNCMIITVKGECKGGMESMAKIISTFTRGEITKAIQLLLPGSKKYSLIFLVSLAATYSPPLLDHQSLLNKIITCPDDHVFSMDLMVHVKANVPRKYSGIIPIISNSLLTFEYIHQLLFGCPSEVFTEWVFKKEGFLDIDSGKILTESKSSGYENIDKKCRLVSSTSDVFAFSCKLIRKYFDDTQFTEIGIGKDGSEKSVKEKKTRKTIPKAIRNQLWRKYFGNQMTGACFCCKSELNVLENWEASHVIAASQGGGDNLENLRPLCSSCNRSMRAENMDEYMKRYGYKI